MSCDTQLMTWKKMYMWQSQVESEHYSVGGVIEIQIAITKDCGSEIYYACVQSFIKGYRKSDFNKAF